MLWKEQMIHRWYTAVFNPKHAGDEQLAIKCIQNCINDIKQWMRANKLKLNDDKTKLLILSSKSILIPTLWK